MSTTEHRSDGGRRSGPLILGTASLLFALWATQVYTTDPAPELHARTVKSPNPRSAHATPSRIATEEIRSTDNGDSAVAAPLPVSITQKSATPADVDIPPMESTTDSLSTSIGLPMDADMPPVETDSPYASVIRLGPIMDADDPLGMAQTAATEVVSIGDVMSADE